MSVTPGWVERAKSQIKTTGKVDLSGDHIEDLSLLGKQRMMRHLNLSYTQLTSIAGLLQQPSLDGFTSDGSMLSSFENFESIKTIKTLSIKGTPAAQTPNFQISALIICPNLVSINSKLIPRSLKDRAESYPPICEKLINLGWMATYPCPDDDELSQIAKEFGYDEPEEDINERAVALDDDYDDFEEKLQRFYKRHDRMVYDIKVECGFIEPEEEEEEEEFMEEENIINLEVVEEEDEEIGYLEEEENNYESMELVNRVAEILRQNGIVLDEDSLEASVLKAVNDLCDENASATSETSNSVF